MKRVMTLLLAVALLLGGLSLSAAAQDAGKGIVIATVSSTGGLDPAGFALDMWTEYTKLCVDPLVSFDNEGKLVYEAAESYETSADGLTWTFHLRKDAKWSDGSPVTAADFVNTIRRALDPNNGNAIYANMLFGIAGAQEAASGGSIDAVKAIAQDDYTLVFTLTAPCAYFLKMMNLPVFYPSKAGLATNENEGWYKDPALNLGSGAFCLSEYTDGVGYTVKKNPNYWQQDKVALDSIKVLFITDQTALFSAYQTGEVNVAAGLPDYVADMYKDSGELFTWNMLTSKFMLPNLAVKPLDDVRVRKAIALALNRAEMCAVIGKDCIPSVNYVAESMLSTATEKPFKDEQEPLITEDIAAAQVLLADAGYPGGAGFPAITYTYPNSDKDSLMAQAIQAQLKQNLGIEVTLNGEESQAYAQDKKDGNYQLIRHSWTADFNDPINFLNLYVSGSSSNYNGTANPDFDAAIAASDKASDPAERNAALHTAQNILVAENFYVIPCVTQVYYCLKNVSITGVNFNDKGEPMYRFAGFSG